MRLFVALDLPEPIRDELHHQQVRLKSLGWIDGNFVRPSNLHLTFRFLGHVAESNVPAIVAALNTVKYRSFSVQLGPMGYFTSGPHIRVIWVHLESEHLFSLANRIEQALEPLVGPPEKPFASHVTLVRVKRARNEVKLADAIEHAKIKPLGFEVTGFTLKSSLTLPEGPQYQDLAIFPCRH